MKSNPVSQFASDESTAVCPYLMVDSVEHQVEFLKQVFGAVVTDDGRSQNGFIQHGEVLIGNTRVMMGRASQRFPSRQSMNYVYVKDADKVYHKALSNGAEEIMAPADRDYGNREGGFIDPFGNQWWVAQVLGKPVEEDAVTAEDRLKHTELVWNKFIEDNNVEEMAKFMADDWIIFSGDGNITTKAIFLQLVTTGDLVHTKMDFEILQVRIYGRTGMVMQRGISAGTWKGESFSNYEIATSIFIKDDVGWRSVQTMIAPARS